MLWVTEAQGKSLVAEPSSCTKTVASSKQTKTGVSGGTVSIPILCLRVLKEFNALISLECHLPPTFQSWFTVTNLHVWLLTVRLRALQPPHGPNHIQGLIDHFFLDVEDRIRTILQPASETPITPSSYPYTRSSSFYTIANADKRPKGRAPERLVTQQMKIFREQWQGMGMSFDHALVKGDDELAAVVWRNILGARGARGIVYPSTIHDSTSTSPNSSSSSSSSPVSLPGKSFFRRSVNLVGGEVIKVKKIDERGLEVEEARDDGSGVHDHAPNEADKYVAYPELMATIIDYIRRETARLDALPDEALIGPGISGTESHGIDKLRFGSVRQAEEYF